MASSPFLTAAWRKLIMANYVVPEDLLLPYLPKHTELDLYGGQCYVSLIGFLFADVRLKGWRIPFHTCFEEVNLRFYVRHTDASGMSHRGVVFLQELVPRLAVSVIANTIYGEHYRTRRTKHSWTESANNLQVSYEWQWAREWKKISVLADAKPEAIAAGSIEEFITEHYWGYTRLGPEQSSGYEVAHPRWQVYPVHSYTIEVDFAAQYGADFSGLQLQEPASVLLAEGSEVSVLGGGRL